MASCQRKQRAALARNARAREQTRENAEGLASVLDLVDQPRRRRLGSFTGNIKPNLGKIGFAEELTALKADIDKGLADVAAGRVKDFDTDRIIARGRKLLADRSPIA